MMYKINGPLTDDLIRDINKLSDGSCICFKNTKGLKSNDFKKIKSTLKVRIVGGLDEIKKPKYKRYNYFYRTLYKPNELVKILEKIELIESRIDKSWNDLDKAVYIYRTLCEGMEYDTNEMYGNDDKNRNLHGLIINMSVCAGFAMIYKEFMDRQGIECDYQNRQHSHAWNVIKIDGVYYPVDLTWDVCNKDANGKCLFRYFANDPNFFKDLSHIGTNEMIIPSNTLDPVKFNQAYNKVSGKKVSNKKGIRYVNKFGKEIIYTINKRNGLNQLFILYDGKLKSVLYNNENDLNYLLNLDYSNGDTFTLDIKSNPNLGELSKRIRIITRSDGSQLYIEDTLNMEDDKNKFNILKYNDNNVSFCLSKIISEERLATKSNDSEREKYISDVLLSDSRIREKISKFGGYVGFVRKEMGKFIKSVDVEYEKNISGINRF